MTTQFPTALDTFTNPTASDALNSVTVPHVDQHANANDAIEALQAKVGIDGSADPTSLDKRVSNLEASPATPNHNDTLNLNSGDYLHLTAAEKTTFDGVDGRLDSLENLTGNMGGTQIINVSEGVTPVTGEWYSSVAAAVAYAGTIATSGNRVLVNVFPGEYTESPFTVPAYVILSGMDEWGGAKLTTNDNSAAFITMAANSGLTRFNVAGPTGVGFATIDMTASGVSKVYWVNITQGYYGVWAHASSGTARIHCVGVVSESITGCNSLFRCTANSNIMMMQSGAMTATGLTYGCYADGAAASFTLDLCMFRGSGSTSVYADNLATVRGIACSFAQGNTAIHHGPNGAIITFHGTTIKQGGYTTDINIAGSAGSFAFSGTATKSKITKSGATVPTIVFDDQGSGAEYIYGELYIGSTSGQTPLTTYIAAGRETGTYSGGSVTRVSGLDVSVAAGSGFFDIATVLQNIPWGGTTLTLPASQEEVWIQVDNTGTVSAVTVEPDETQVLILATAVTDSTDVMFLARQQFYTPHAVGSLNVAIKHGLGPLFIDGGVVSKSAATSLQLDVSAAEFFLGGDKITPSAGNTVTFVYWYQDGAGGFVKVGSQSSIDVVNYDDGSGTLAAMTAGKYRRDLVYVAENGTGTEYHVVYGQTQYDSVGAATLDPTNLPEILQEYACRLAAVIVQEGSADISSIVDRRPFMGQYAPQEATDKFNILSAGTQTAATNATVGFVNSNGVTFGMSGNSQITASVAAQSVQTQNMIVAAVSDVTYTSGTVEFLGSNAATVRSDTGQKVIIDVPTQTVQAQSYSLVGGVAGNSTVTANQLYLSGGNNITLSGTGNTIVVSAGNATGGQFSAGVSTAGNSLGNTGITGTQIVFVGSDNITLSQVSGPNGATINFIGGAGAAGNTGYVQAGSTSMSLGTVSFANSNGVSFGLDAGTLTATVKTDYLTSQTVQTQNVVVPAASNVTYTSGTVEFVGSGAVTVQTSAGQHIVIDAPVQSVQTQGSVAVQGSTGAISFANGNNVTFGFNASTVTASIPAGATATGNLGAIGANTQTASSGTVVFGNGNNVSFGLNNQTLTASIPAGATATGNVGSIVGSNATYTSGAITFTGSGAVTVRSTTGQQIVIDSPVQTVQTQGSVAVNGSTGAISFANGNNVTFGFNASTVTASASFNQSVQTQGSVAINGSTGAISFSNSNNVSFGFNGSTITATATVAPDANKAGTGFSSAGANISMSGTNNTAGLSLSLSVAAQSVQPVAFSASGGSSAFSTLSFSNQANGITFSNSAGQVAVSHSLQQLSNTSAITSVAMNTSERANFFATSNNTFANSTHSHGNPTLALTNLSGTTASASNGLTISLSAGAGAGGGIVVATNNTGGGTSTVTGTVTFGNLNGLTFYQSNGSVVGSYTDAGAGAGISAVVISAGGSNNSLSNFSFANANNVSFSINGSTISGSINAGAAVITRQSFDNMGPLATASGALGAKVIAFRSLSVFPLKPYQDIFNGVMTIGTIGVDLSISGSTATLSGALSTTCRLGLYVLNTTAATLSLDLVNSVEMTFGHAGVATNNSTAWAGQRFFSAHSSQWSSQPVLSDGVEYYCGMLFVSGGASSAQTNSIIGGYMFSTVAHSGFVGVAPSVATWNGRGKPLGIYTVSTTGIPAGINYTQINKQSASANFIPHIVGYNHTNMTRL